MAKNIEINYYNESNTYEPLYPAVVQSFTYHGTGSGSNYTHILTFPQHYPYIFGIAVNGTDNINQSQVFITNTWYQKVVRYTSSFYNYFISVFGEGTNQINITYTQDGATGIPRNDLKFDSVFNHPDNDYTVYWIV